MSANVWQQSHCMNGEGRTCRPAVQLPRALSQTSRQGRCGRRQRAEAIRAQRHDSRVEAASTKLTESEIKEAQAPEQYDDWTATGYQLEEARQAAKASMDSQSPEEWVDRFGDEPRKGADIVVQCLEREGAHRVFAYPGGCSMEIHQALTRSNLVKNTLCRHEQGEIFAAEGYAKTTGDVGVCIATSGPGATNLVTGLADALLDSVPMVAITGQVPRKLIGTDAFQETPIVEVTRQITKHNYLVMDIADLPRVIKEVFYLARTGRPGPVLVHVPKDIQQW